MFRIEQIIRKNVFDLIPYSSARDEYSGKDAVYFDANENPFNRPINRYPDPLQKELKEKISEQKKVPAENIFLGNGSDEAIDLLIRLSCDPGKNNVLLPQPTYGMYEVAANINDVEVKKVLLNQDFQLDTSALLKEADDASRIIFLCSPNNPTGNSFRESDIIYLLKEFAGLVVVDEAYIDFAPHDGLLRYLNNYPNLVVLQTFSKAWGLAGMRLGMAAGDRMLVSMLNKIKYPYNISYLAQKIAVEAIIRKTEKEMWVKSILQQKKHLIEAFNNLPFIIRIYPSDANFILIRVKDADGFYHFLENRKMIVRNRSSMPLCEGCLRITVGTEIENKKLIMAFQEYKTCV